MTAYQTLVADAAQFCNALAVNNTKDWWVDNKTTYDIKLKAPALALLDEIATPLAALTDLPITTKLFRPHRDVRFSKDKTPYNTHLHMMWTLDSDAPQKPVFFFGIGQDYVSTGAGIMGFDKPVLTNWRKMVDLDTDRIMDITTGLQSAGFAFRDPALKRVPAPFDQDHPAANLLRMKGVVASREASGKGALTDQVMGAFTALWPLNDLLISIAEA